MINNQLKKRRWQMRPKRKTFSWREEGLKIAFLLLKIIEFIARHH
jgi:hypothetical protein